MLLFRGHQRQLCHVQLCTVILYQFQCIIQQFFSINKLLEIQYYRTCGLAKLGSKPRKKKTLCLGNGGSNIHRKVKEQEDNCAPVLGNNQFKLEEEEEDEKLGRRTLGKKGKNFKNPNTLQYDVRTPRIKKRVHIRKLDSEWHQASQQQHGMLKDSEGLPSKS